VTRALDRIDPAMRRRIVDVHPDALALAERLLAHPTVPIDVSDATTSGGRTTFSIEINGRPHRLILERIPS
jgi:hypothetical protein